MNKIYKVVWSKVKNCYVVVSEIAKNVISGSVKSAKIGDAPVVKGMALGALMALVITGNAWAAGGYYNGHYYIFSNYKEFTENTSMSTWRALFTGDNEPGVYHTVNANGNTITLTGKISGSVPLNEYGFSYHGGIMRLYDASKIEFAGDYKSGIYAYVGNYAQFTDIGDIVQTSGSFSEGYFINNYGSTVEIDANNIDVNGGITSTYCDYTVQGVVYGTTDINVSENITLNGNINAYQQSNINIDANQSNITGNITAKSGSVVSVTANTNNLTGNMVAEGENSRINITANSQGNIVGDVSALSGGGVSLDLAGSGSSFTGSSTTDDTKGGVVLDLTQSATWYVTGDSKVDSIVGDDFNIIAANGMKDINLTIECGNHNLDVDDYYDHTNSTLRGVNMFLVAPTEDGLTDGVSINSDSDVTVKSATEHGISINSGGKVAVSAADVNIDSFKAAIWVEKNGDELNKGEVYVNASGDVYLKSEDRFAINNESTNNGIVDVRGNNITIISESMPAIKVGETIYSEGYDGIVNISGEKITLKGASHEIVDGWQQRASVLYASGGTINVDAADSIMVTDTAKVGGNAVGAYNGGNINIKDSASVDVDGKVYAHGEGSKIDIANAGNVSVTSTSGSAINSASNNSTIKIGDAQTVKITGATQNLSPIKNANGEIISYNEDNRAVVYAKGTVNIIAADKVEIVDNNNQKAISAFGGANVTVDGGKKTLIYGEINADGHEYVGQPGGRIEHQDNGIGEKINIAVNGNEIFIDAKGGEAVYARGDSIGGDEAAITIGDVDTEKVSITNTTNGLAAMYDGSKVKVNGEYLAINATSGDEDAGIGIYAANNDTVYSNPATVDVKTKKTKITVDDSGHAGIWARYHGVINVDNGLEIQAKNAIIASGGAQVNINESGNGVVKIDGDVEFNNIGTDDNPNAGADNNHSGVNADININLSTADSYLKGNIFTTNGNHEKNLDFIKYVEGMNLSISNGATWETDASSFVNSLYVNGGNITVKNAHKGSVVVDELTGNKVSVKVDELVDETVKFGTVADSVEVTLGVANGGDLGVDVKQGVQEYYDAVVDGTGKTAVDNISIEQFNLKAALDITSDDVVTTIKPGDKFVVESEVVATGDVFAGDGSSIKGNASAIDKLDESLENKADRASTLAGYGITNAYTKTEMDEALAGKVDAGKATGTWAVAVGKYANAETNYSVAIGGTAKAGADYSIAIGGSSETKGKFSVAVGHNSTATGYNSVSIGYISESGYNAVALGGYALATGVYSVGVGESSFATGMYSTAVGHFARALENYTVAIGESAIACKNGSVALGHDASAQHEGAVAIGMNSITSDENTVSFGHKIGDTDDHIIGSSGYSYNLYRRLTNVADGIDDHDVVTVGQLNSVVSTKANVSDVYTKTEVDTALDGKADRADISVLDSQVEAFSTTRDEKGKVTGATITGTVNAHDFSAGNYTLRQVGSYLNTLDRLAIKNGQYMIDDRFDSLSMMSQSADMFYLTTENIDRTAYTSMGLEKGRFYISNHNIDGTASAELYVSGTQVGVNGDFVVSDWNGKKFTVASNGKVTGGTYNGVEIKSVNNNAVIGGINLSTLATQQDTEELQGNIDAEITNREAADIALESKVTESYKSADTVLSGRIDETQASIALKADLADVYTKTAADEKFAEKASTLSGYGIADAYTKEEVETMVASKVSSGKNYDDYSLAVGRNSDAGHASLAVGVCAEAKGEGSIAIGSWAEANVENSLGAIAIGTSSKAEGLTSLAIGSQAQATEKDSIAIGNLVKANYEGAIAIAYGALADAEDAIAFGRFSKAIYENSMALGVSAEARGINSSAIGSFSSSLHNNSVAIGYGSVTNDDNTVSFGHNAGDKYDYGTDGPLTFGYDLYRRLTHVADGINDHDVVTVGQLNSIVSNKANASDVYTKTEVDTVVSAKADKADTLSGYGITDAYNKAEVDSEIVAIKASVTEAYKSADTELEGRVNAKLGEVENAYQQADAALEGKVTNAYKAADVALESKVTEAYESADTVLSGRIDEAQASIALKANIADVYTKTVADEKFAVKASTLAGYGITDAYTQAEVNAKIADATSGLLTDANLAGKADKADTLFGYGITDAYTKAEVDSEIVAMNASVTEAYKSADIELEGRINAKLGEVENAYQAADIALEGKVTNAYQAADIALESKITNAYQAAEIVLESKVTNAYQAADIALESKVTEAYKSADEVLRSGYETADNALSGRINEAQASIALKANIADIYTKTVADEKFAVKASTLAGYGITDAYTQAEVNAKIADATSGLLTDANLTGKADKADTLSGYGIADAYTKDEVNAKIADATSGLLTDANLAGKADKADTLSGYGITDAYTKVEVDGEIVAMKASVTEEYKSADTELEGRVTDAYKVADVALESKITEGYQQADAALEGNFNTRFSEVEFAYKQADEVIMRNIAAMGKAYADADVALERRVTAAYENADKALKSGYEAADNTLRDYIDQKVDSIVTDANVIDLQNKTQNITAEAGKTFVDGEINTDSLTASGNVVANGSVIGGSVVSSGNVEAGGDIITSNGDVKAGDVSLQNTANQVEANKVAIENVKTDLSAELDKKANAFDVYTKDEVYTKAEADAIFVKQTAVKTEDEEGNTTITTDTVVKQNVVEVKDVDGNITTTTKTEIDNNFVVEGSDKGAEVSINKDTDSQVIIGADGKMIFGTNSTAIDKHGVYAGRIDETGDHDYANAKAAINDEGEVKAASGKFTVDKDGNVNATSYNGINLEQFVNNSQEAISGLNQRLGQMNGKINKVGAGAAALAALHPLEYDPDDKLTFSAGVGNYAGENAAALGAFYRPDEKLMFSLGGTMGNGENMVNLGVSIGLDGAKGTPKLSRKELVQIVAAMHAESKEIKTENEAIKAENVALEERVAKLEALVAKLAEK